MNAKQVTVRPRFLSTKCQQSFLMLLLGLFAHATLAERPVAALGFVEPEGGSIRLTGTSSGGTVVSELNVAEGDSVAAGSVIAILDNHERLQAAMHRAEAKVNVRQAMLTRLKAGAKAGAVKAQKARINRLQVESNNASAECKRYRRLKKKGTVSDALLEQTCLQDSLLRGQLVEARAGLDEITEIREVDIAVSQAELGDSEAALEVARVDFQRSMVRAPFAGQVLRVYTKKGETFGPEGIIELGRTDQMWIRAEVYETDVSRVAVGQSATITSDGFSGKIHGTVENVGLMIGRNRIIATDPTADVDARVVEVAIKLDSEGSAKVARLSNLQVNVVIQGAD